MRLILMTFAIFAVYLHQSEAKKAPKHIDDLCKKVKCAAGQVCRVVEKCGNKRKLQAKCINCVPQGADKVCNFYNYERAVLGGPKRNLNPVSCHIHGVPNKFQCPDGSDCKGNFETPGLGFCCHGKVTPGEGQEPMPVGSVSNNDPVCRLCSPPCKNGKTCQADVSCGRLIHVCKDEPKTGICPTSHQSHPCTDDDKARHCEEDSDCDGALKCCLSACGGTVCRLGYYYAGLGK